MVNTRYVDVHDCPDRLKATVRYERMFFDFMCELYQI